MLICEGGAKSTFVFVMHLEEVALGRWKGGSADYEVEFYGVIGFGECDNRLRFRQKRKMEENKMRNKKDGNSVWRL